MDPATLEAFSRLTAGGLLVAAIAALVFRWVYTRGEVKDREAVWVERLAEVRADRDAWKANAQDGLVKVADLTNAVNVLGAKLP